MVIFVDSDSSDELKRPQFYLQTFKIDLATTFYELKKGIINFWDLIERENEFIMKFIDEDGECNIIRNEEEIIDTFLKGKSNMKKAKFVFLPNNLSIVFTLIILENLKDLKSISDSKEQDKSNNQNKFNIDGSTDKFLSKFLGLRNYLHDKLIRIKKRAEIKETINENKLWLPSSFLSLFHLIILIAFLYLTLESLIYKAPPDKSYFINNTIKNAFTSVNISQVYLSKNQIINDILERVNDLFYNGKLLKSIIMVNRMRFSFVLFIYLFQV